MGGTYFDLWVWQPNTDDQPTASVTSINPICPDSGIETVNGNFYIYEVEGKLIAYDINFGYVSGQVESDSVQVSYKYYDEYINCDDIGMPMPGNNDYNPNDGNSTGMHPMQGYGGYYPNDDYEDGDGYYGHDDHDDHGDDDYPGMPQIDVTCSPNEFWGNGSPKKEVFCTNNSGLFTENIKEYDYDSNLTHEGVINYNFENGFLVAEFFKEYENGLLYEEYKAEYDQNGELTRVVIINYDEYGNKMDELIIVNDGDDGHDSSGINCPEQSIQVNTHLNKGWNLISTAGPVDNVQNDNGCINIDTMHHYVMVCIIH
jgi:hypothetical protein